MPASPETRGDALVRSLKPCINEISPSIGSPTLCSLDLQVVLPEGAYDITPKLAIEYDSVAFDTKCGALP